MSQPATKPTKQLTEVEALARITKVLNQLDTKSRAKVLAFLVAE
jgi:hypothetical protein